MSHDSRNDSAQRHSGPGPPESLRDQETFPRSLQNPPHLTGELGPRTGVERREQKEELLGVEMRQKVAGGQRPRTGAAGTAQLSEGGRMFQVGPRTPLD